MIKQSKLEHRGFMLDTGRKFFPVDSILYIIDMLHSHNLNKFHWHIYDAQNFPLQFQYQSPHNNKTSIKMQGQQFYTKQQILYIVQYANNKDIDIIPQFQMPAHCDIWGYYYQNQGIICGKYDRKKPVAQLNLGLRETYEVLKQFLGNFLQFFPNQYAHFGGDQIAGIWPDTNHNQTLTKFYNNFILDQICTINKKHPIIWQDCITQKNLPISHNFTIQVYKPLYDLAPNSPLQQILHKNYRTIISTSQTWYIGNATIQKIKQYQFIKSQYVIGGELVWFTSQGDHVEIKGLEWLEELVQEAGVRFQEFNQKIQNN